MSNFIPRTYIDNTTNENISFDEIVARNNISIILGEPASGKTYQLEQYEEQNENSVMIELLSIEDEDPISSDIDVVLLDSIDEALSKNDSDRILIRNLLKYIKTSQSVNPNVKFIITCRYVEWKEIFEEKLKEIDKEFTIYYIQELSKGDIDKLIMQHNVNQDEFWNFIEINYLEQLLKNILMVIHLIEDFDNYKGQKLKYFEIYEKIITSHLTIKTNNERDKRFKKFNQKEILNISSIIASYMVLNRLETINIEQINQLSIELFQLTNVEITGEKLELLFDTALFKGTREKVGFFHKSIKEYLSAYFINIKKLDIKTIKDIFAHKDGFYEEFEEVIIYLTNMEEKFFNHFVEFDPFIFRRHPYLNENEQRSLLVSILNLLQNEKQRIWSKWKYIESSSLVRLNLVKNINEIIRKHISIKNVDIELFTYLKSLLEYDYDKKLEDIIFGILEHKKIDKRICIEFMSTNFIENIDYNKKLFSFIVTNDLIDIDEDYLYLRIFNRLYGYIEFKELIILIKNFSLSDVRELSKIKLDDIIVWIKDIIKNYNNQNDQEYSNEQISYIVFLVLQSFNKLEDKYILIDMINFIDKEMITISCTNYADDIHKYKLNFNDIEGVFWNYYFSEDKDSDKCWSSFNILWFYSINIEDIQEISIKFAIEKYLYHYLYIKNRIGNNEITDYLLDNNKFKNFIEELNKKQEERDKKWKDKHSSNIVKREEKKKIELELYQNAIKSLNSSNDVYNIYGVANLYKEKKEKVNDKLLNDLGDKYPIFINLLKNEFKKNKLHQNIKININTNSVPYWTFRFDYLFSVISDDEVYDLIDSKKEYEKLFYHSIKGYKLMKKYFVNISKKYKNELIDYSIDILYLSLTQSNFKSCKIDYQLVRLYKEVNIFDKIHLEKLIDKIKQIYYHKFTSLDYDSKKNLLQILSLDSNNYSIIHDMLKSDSKNTITYCKILIDIDVNRAVKNYIDEIYPKSKNKLNFALDGKISFLTPLVSQYNKFNILNICNKHREAFKNLVVILSSNSGHREYSILHKLDNEHKEFILLNYYEFFKEFYYPKGGFDSNEIYIKMNDLINSLFDTFTDDISLLEKLENTSNVLFKTRVKRQLEEIYNTRLKNGKFNNDYYKNILDNFIEEGNRFFDYEKLQDDLVSIALRLMDSRKSIYEEKEDLINDRFRDALEFKDYYVLDQSRGGESESSKSVGERDIVIRNKENGITETVIEAFNLDSLDRTVIEKHYKKLIEKYDTTGNKQNFILVYSKAKEFNNLWEKYRNEYLESEEDMEKANIKLGYSNEGNMKIVHLFINFNTIQEVIDESN